MRVGKAMRIEPAEGIMREEKRPAAIRPKRQCHAAIALAVSVIRIAAETLFIDLCADGMMRRARRQDVDNQRLVPTANGMVHRPAMLRTPVPVEDILAAPVPIPFHAIEKRRDARRQAEIFREILPRREK